MSPLASQSYKPKLLQQRPNATNLKPFLTMMSGPSALVAAKVDGVPLKVLIDTGSSANLIELQQFTAIRNKTQQAKSLEPFQGKLNDAEGKPMAVLGKVEVTLEVAGIKAPTDVLVVHNLSVPMLIGTAFLTKNKCAIDFDTRRFYTDKESTAVQLENDCRMVEQDRSDDFSDPLQNITEAKESPTRYGSHYEKVGETEKGSEKSVSFSIKKCSQYEKTSFKSNSLPKGNMSQEKTSLLSITP